MKVLKEKETTAIGLECRSADGESWSALYPMKSEEAAWAQYELDH